MKVREIVAEAATGYVLNPERSYFAAVVPEAGANLVTNPECITLEGYADLGGAGLSLSDSVQRRGIYSITCVAGAGAGLRYLLGGNLTVGQHYTFSVDIKGPGRFAISFGNASGVQVGHEVAFEAPTFWNRYHITLLVETTVRSVRVVSIDGGTFHADGFQVEPKPYPTTFISGNLTAPADTSEPGGLGYAWIGPPHRSMSYRSEGVSTGGRIVPLSELGLEVTDFSGFGYQQQEPIVRQLAMLPAAVFDGVTAQARQFTIGGFVRSPEIFGLLSQRGQIGSAVTGRSGGNARPILLHCQLFDGERPISELAEIECIYVSGLEGVINNIQQEKVAITFSCWRSPLVVDGNRTLLVDASDQTTGLIAVAYPDGTVDSIPGPGGTITTGMAIGTDNCLYVGAGNLIKRWNGGEWSTAYTLVPGAGTVYFSCVGEGPDGRIYFAFQGLGGPHGVLAYSPSSGAVDFLNNTVVSSSGDDPAIKRIRSIMLPTVYGIRPVVGFCGRTMTVSNDHPSTSGGIFVYYDLDQQGWAELCIWTTPPIDADPVARDFAVDGRHRLWIVGSFHTGTSMTADIINVAIGDVLDVVSAEGVPWQRYAVLAYGGSTISYALDAPLYAIHYDERNATMLVGGTFDRWVIPVGGSPYTTMTSPNLAQFDTLVDNMVYTCAGGVGFYDATIQPIVRSMIAHPVSGEILVAGSFDNATSRTLLLTARGLVWYNTAGDTFSSSILQGQAYQLPGGKWYYRVDRMLMSERKKSWYGGYNLIDYQAYGQFVPTLDLFGKIPGLTGALYAMGSGTGFSAAGVQSIVVGDGAIAWPRIEVRGPCTLYSIVNATTGKALLFNEGVSSGEVLIVDVTPGASSIFSSSRGRIAPSVAGGNAYPDFPLVAGDNRLIIVMDDAGGASAAVMWREQYASFDALVRSALG